MANATFTAKFTTAGTYTWVAPTGVTSVQVECWGAGGGGSWNGAAAGGGEYAAEAAQSVTAGSSYTVVVGAPGAGGGTSTGGNGASSTFNSTSVVAHGGSQGNNTTGGAGGTGSSNTTHHNGGAGANNGGSTGGGGGGSAGPSSAGNAGTTGGTGGSAVTGGGAGGTGTNGTGGAGGAPGGGGGGGFTTGGAGHAGQVVITWTMASPATISAATTGGTYQWTAPTGASSATWTITGTATFDGHSSSSSESVTTGTAYTISVGASSSLVINWAGNVGSTGTFGLAKLAVTATGFKGTPTSGTFGLAKLGLAGTVRTQNNATFGMPGLGLSATGKVGRVASGTFGLAKLASVGTEHETFVTTGTGALGALGFAGSGKVQYAFPPGPLGLLFELLVGGVWTNITSYVYQRQTVTIVRGRGDESSAGTSNPASCTLTLNNRDGRFSPRNPNSPYYLLIGRNTQFRVSAPTTGVPPWVRGYRFWGEVAEWPPTWDQTGQDIAVQITANGILRRLNQNAPLHSALFRYYETLASPPLAYWPAEDGANATSLASGLPSGFVMTFTGVPQLASDSGLPASGAFPAFNGATFTGPTGVAGALPIATTEVLSATGTHTWVAPTGIDSVLVQCWGGGGGGSGANGSTGGAGGGGAEYASDSLAVTPGNSYSYTIGSSSVAGAGGTTTMHGDSSSTVVAHGGAAGSSDGATGGAGGTGSTNTTHFDGGAGAAGSGGPGGGGGGGGGGGDFVQNNQTFTSDGTWTAPSDIASAVSAYVWGAGGGGGSGGGSGGGGGGGGGGFSSGNVSVGGGSNNTVKVGNGGAGGTSGGSSSDGGQSYFKNASTVQADGGQAGHSSGIAGPGGSGSTHTGGHGGAGGSSGNKGGGGGGGASYGGGGGTGGSSASGGGGGSGAGGGGLGLSSGGSGGGGGSSSAGNRSGDNGGARGGGGGGGYTTQFGASDSGGNGGRGEVQLFWYEDTGGGGGGGGDTTAAQGGGGGSSGGSSSAGNDGDTEAGGVAVNGGGPGGGTLAGATFTAAPTTGPGGGGGGYDSAGNNAAGASGLITLSYAPGGTGGGSGSAANVFRFVLHIDAGGDTDGAEVARMYTTGTIAYISVIYNQANNGSLTLSGFTGAGAQLFTSGQVAFGCDGEYLLVSAELQTSGSNIAWQLTGVIAGHSTTAATASGSLLSATLGDPFSIVMNPAGGLTSAGFGHVAALETYDPVTDLAGALAAYAGETAAVRFARICTEQGIPYTVIDVGASDTTAPVGPQLPVTVTTLLQDCEDADRGLLFEPRDQFGVAYRSRYSLYAQAAAAQVDYSIGEVAYPLTPTDDDQLVRNDVTMTRPNGSSSEFVVSSGTMSVQDPPNGIGLYTFSQTVNVNTDGQLPDIASWVAFLGTIDQLRYPQINLDLIRSEIGTDFPDIVGMDVGDYLQIVNTVPPIPPGDIRQLMYGYTESLNAFVWTISANCVPETPYEVALAYDTVAGVGARAETNGSQLATGIGTGDTTFSVTTPVPNAVWIDSATYPAQFPFDVIVSGERMTVTEIDNTTSPQTFTVTRAVNGVQKTHNTGESITLFNPPIIAL